VTEGNEKDPGNKIQHKSGSKGTARLEVKGCSRIVAVQRYLEFICPGTYGGLQEKNGTDILPVTFSHTERSLLAENELVVSP